MAENSVTTTFFADEKEAAAAITRLEKKYDDLENKLRHVHRESKEGGEHAIEALKELGTFAVSAGLGFTTAMGAVEKFAEVSREARKEADDAARAAERMQTRLNIQTGQFGVAGRANLDAVRSAAFGAGRSQEETGRLFTALMSSGRLTAEEAQGAIGGQSKAFAAAFEARGGNLSPEQFAAAVSGVLDKQAAKTPAALGGAARDVFAAFQGTNLSAEDITQAAGQLSTLGAGKGRLRHAQSLAQIGLKLSDVDLQGEGLFEAAGKIRGGLENVPVERRQALLQEIFGDAGLGNRLLGAEGAMGGKRALLEPAVAAATGGRDQAEARARQLAEIHAEGNADETDLALQALDIQRREAGFSDFRRVVGGGLNAFNRSFNRSLGLTTGAEEVESALSAAPNPERAREIFEQLKGGGSEEMQKLLERQTEILEKNGSGEMEKLIQRQNELLEQIEKNTGSQRARPKREVAAP